MSARRLVAATLMLATVALTGCDEGDPVLDDDDAIGRLEADAAAVDGVVADLLGPLTDALAAGGSAGKAGYRQCGMEPQPSGARYSSRPQLSPVGISPAEGLEAVTSLLQDDGWTVKSSEGGTEVTATRDDISVRVLIGGFAADVLIESACVDTSADLAREYSSKPSTDIG